MIFVLWLGLLCSCIFMTVCLECMQAFDVGWKRTVVFSVICGVVGGVTSFILVLLGVEFGFWHFYFYVGALLIVLNSFNYKSVIKGIVSGVMGALLLFGVDGMTTLFLLILGHEVDSFNWNIAFFVHVFVVCMAVFILRYIFKKRIDMSIFNSKSTYLVTALSGVMIIITYIVYKGDELPIGGGITYALAFLSVAVMFAVIMNYVFKDNGRKPTHNRNH